MRIGIVGGGPAGLFAALELANEFEVSIFERNSYVGGSGLHSDGKLNFNPQIGGDIAEFVGDEDAWKVINKVRQTFIDLGISPMKTELSKTKINLGFSNGLKFMPIEQAHIGSDYLPLVMAKLEKTLLSKGVKIYKNRTITEIDVCPDKLILRTDTGAEFQCDKILLALGRGGTSVLPVIDGYKFEFKWNPIDVGVRVETLAKVMEPLTDECWDAKLYLRTSSYDDLVRTFCTCPYGFVIKEVYPNTTFGINGHSMKDIRSKNTNFALLVSVNLTEPLENTNSYGSYIAQLTNVLGGGKPLIQRLGDLKSHRRSTVSRIKKSYIEPTLKEYTPGDIAMAYPQRIVTNIVEMIEKLDSIVPGLNSDSTLLYVPEIKFYATRILTDSRLRTNIPNISVAGDGAGVSRGIVGAASTGIVAARGMKE